MRKKLFPQTLRIRRTAKSRPPDSQRTLEAFGILCLTPLHRTALWQFLIYTLKRIKTQYLSVKNFADSPQGVCCVSARAGFLCRLLRFGFCVCTRLFSFLFSVIRFSGAGEAPARTLLLQRQRSCRSFRVRL